MRLGIVGATGVVGKTFIKVLEEKALEFEEIRFFASKRSAGKEIEYNNKKYYVEELNEDSFDNLDFALFSAGASTSKKYSDIASKKGCIVIDNSSAFRMDSDVELIVPEVNGERIEFMRDSKKIIANPNCSTIQCMEVLSRLHKKYGLKRVIYSTYQAVSGSGIKGIKDLEKGLNGESAEFYSKDIAFNCLPLIDELLDNGYTKEEIKMIEETRKILNIPDLNVTATCVRVPVWNGHSVSVNVELEKEFEIEEIKKILSESDSLVLTDEIPTILDCNGQDKVFVGRIRRDFSVKNGINFWCVADNIRKGAATNAIQILELFLGGKNEKTTICRFGCSTCNTI